MQDVLVLLYHILMENQHIYEVDHIFTVCWETKKLPHLSLMWQLWNGIINQDLCILSVFRR